MTSDDLVNELLIIVLYTVVTFTNKMLQQIEDLSKTTHTEIVRPIIEHIASPVIETWQDEEEFIVFGKKFNLPQDKENFLKYLKSKIWCSYRKGFCQIGGDGPSSDSGWGCMLRSGQMLLAETFTRLYLGNDWLYDEERVHNRTLRSDSKYWDIINQIIDKRSSRYSIHQIALMGTGNGKNVGEWFGPNSICHAIKKLSQYDEINNLHVHVTNPSTIYIDTIEEELFSRAKDDDRSKLEKEVSKVWKPLLLLVPVRLGLDSFNQAYLEHLKVCLQHPYSVGCVGGKPNQAFYFLGFSDKSLVFLDPHTTQNIPEIPACSKENKFFDDSSYHCDFPRKILFDDIDPSLALGFFIKTNDQFNKFCQHIQSYKTNKNCERVVTVVKEAPKYNFEFMPNSRKKQKKTKTYNEESVDLTEDLKMNTSTDSDESFEVLEEI